MSHDQDNISGDPRAERLLRGRGVDVDRRKAEDRKVVDALREAGVTVTSVYDLVNERRPYPAAIPVLIRLLTTIDEPVVKEGVVRALSVREALGVADDVLIREFRSIAPAAAPAMHQVKWAIGNALGVTANMQNPETRAAIFDLVGDRTHGHARQMLCDALARFDASETVEKLVGLLHDEWAGLVARALHALGELRTRAARAHVLERTKDPDAVIRTAAKAALKKIDAPSRHRRQ